MIVANALDAARRQRTEAVDAGIMRHVNGGVLQAGAAARAVADRVYFAVDDGLRVQGLRMDARNAMDMKYSSHGMGSVFSDAAAAIWRSIVEIEIVVCGWGGLQ